MDKHENNSPHRLPDATAEVNGSAEYPRIYGTVDLYTVKDGTLVYASIEGLPRDKDICRRGVFGFHIHGGKSCTGTASDPFADAGSHFDINGCEHPSHAGDMPPLFSSRGRAVLMFLTDRFTVDEVIGRAVVIHAMPDDLISQPSGNSGKKIACGIIRKRS